MVWLSCVIQQLDLRYNKISRLTDFEEPETVVLQPSEEKVQSERTSLWPICGTLLPQIEIVFICQMIAIYTVIEISLFNLTRGGTSARDDKLRVASLSSCLSYMLPHLKIRQ